jgi:hypothetical protein
MAGEQWKNTYYQWNGVRLQPLLCLENNQALYFQHFQSDGIGISVEKVTALY